MMSVKKDSQVAPTPRVTVEDVAKNVQPKQEIKEQGPTNSYFFLDMRNSLILIALVIALEIALYFAKLIR